MKQHINIVVTILIGVLIAQCYACSRDRIIVDQGQWTKISSFEDSVVKDTYALIDGKIYYGGFDRAFYDSVLCSRPEADLPYLKEAALPSSFLTLVDIFPLLSDKFVSSKHSDAPVLVVSMLWFLGAIL